MKLTDEGVALIKEFEGLVKHPYQDGNGWWTIGYGHKITEPNSDRMEPITLDDAEWLLRNDLQNTCRLVESLVLPIELNDNQFSALVSFVFNEGYRRFHDSFLLRCIRRSDFLSAAQEFPRWCVIAGKASPGLKRRREAEKNLFEKPISL